MEGETQSVRQLMDMGIKGLIIFSTEAEIYNETIIQLSLDKFPVELIDRFFKNIRVSRVTTDNVQGTFDAISYLLNKGHRILRLLGDNCCTFAAFLVVQDCTLS
ncbi:hypothetical protein D3C81_1029470 [compost metagenome]